MLFDNPEKLVPDEILDWLDFCSHGLWQTRQLIFSALPHGQAAIRPRIFVGLVIPKGDTNPSRKVWVKLIKQGETQE